MDISRPPQSAQINCPACGHALTNHPNSSRPIDESDGRCCNTGHIAAELCRCIWTTNDIAWYLLFGGLTPPPAPKPRPLGAWE